MTFDEWYRSLKKYMSLRDDEEGMPLRPEDWGEKETWLKLFNNGFSPEEAFYEKA